MKSPRVSNVPLERIAEPSLSLRQEIDPEALAELAQSMAHLGLLQPILLRREADSYRIIAGHRRYLAARQLGWATIPSIVTDADPNDAIALSLHENSLREDLSPIEEAGLVDYLHDDLGWPLERIAATLRRSESWVRERLRIASWPPDLARAVHDRVLSVAAAEPLAEIDDPEHRHRAIDAARTHGMTRQHAMEWLRQYRQYAAAVGRGEDARPPAWDDVQRAAYVTRCDTCGQETHVDSARLIRVCHRCLQALAHAVPELAARG
ncbi:Chromosome-partitioning protein Spo0J [bacterium HR32]|nr:Chromosome-partitioning protein Spo0J [bacterium HR32]